MTTMMTMVVMAEVVVLRGDCVAFEEKRGERAMEEWSGIEHSLQSHELRFNTVPSF
jgi:hypothetical protein